MFRNLTRFAVIAALSAGACLSGYAQSPTQGAIVGTVTDNSDASVPGAKVVIHNDATNADIQLTTDENGLFRAPQLNPGTYTVSVTMQGFSESKINGVLVQVSNVTSLTPHLKTGDVATTVEVTADAPVLKFDSPDFGGYLSNREIENIPINNRRWSSLALVTPGVTNDTSGFGLISFRATSAILNNVQIDGTDDNQAFFGEERGRTRAGYSTSQVAVREFQVLTGVYSAEYGRAVGGVVNSVTKSGGNTMHGEIYFMRRDDFISSKNPKVTLPVYNPTTQVTSLIPYRPKDKRNQYGFGVGGALVKDKLFWFYAWDQYRRNFPGAAVANNPTTFFAQPSTAVVNQLAAALNVTPTVATQRYNAAINDLATDLGNVPRFGNQDINTPKLDWQINPKHHVSFMYHRLRWDSPGGVQTQAALGYARDSFGTDFVKLDYGVAKLDSLINDHFTNTLRYMYGRELNWEGQQPYTDYTKNTLTGQNGIVPAIALNTSNGFYAGSQYYSYRTSYPDERKWQVGDTAAYLVGKHSIRFGLDIMHSYDVFDNLYQSNGSYFYGTIANYIADVLKPSGACSASTGSTPTIGATGTLGCYSNINQGFGRSKFDLATNDYGFFVQDDWKLTPTLTLNLGARYDYESLPAPYSFAATAPETLNHPSDKNNISPRVGFAYDPFGQGKTVVRGGFGLYYGRNPNGLLLNTYVTTGSAAAQSAVTYYNTTGIKLPNVLAVAPNLAAAPSNIAYLGKNLQNPYAEQFDLTIQQDLGFNHVLSVAYLGSLGRELPNFINTNLDPTKTYTQTYTIAPVNGSCGPVACGTTFSSKVYANRVVSSSTGATTFNTLNPNFNAISGTFSNINSNYHALSVDVTNRSWKRISYDVNYTWAKAMDFNGTQVTAPTANNWYDPYGNARANYAVSSLNVRHRLVGWANIAIPGVNSSSMWSYLANNWSLKPLVQMQSGLPYSVSVANAGGNQCAQVGCLVPYSSGLGGTGVSYIPQLGRNTLTIPRAIVVDARLQKDIKIHERYTFQLTAEGFNIANHQNITGINSTAYTLSGTVLTPQTNFGTPSSSGVNGNYAYQVRQFQFGGRIVF